MLMGVPYTHAYLVFKVRVRMLYTRGFLHVFRRYWFSQDHNGRITFSYPRFLYAYSPIFHQYETQNPPFFSGRLIDRPKCTSLRFPIRRLVLHNHKRQYGTSDISKLSIFKLLRLNFSYHPIFCYLQWNNLQRNEHWK